MSKKRQKSDAPEDQAPAERVYLWNDVKSDADLNARLKSVYGYDAETAKSLGSPEKASYMPWKIRELAADFLCPHKDRSKDPIQNLSSEDDDMDVNSMVSALASIAKEMKRLHGKSREHAAVISQWIKECKPNIKEAYADIVQRLSRERQLAVPVLGAQKLEEESSSSSSSSSGPEEKDVSSAQKQDDGEEEEEKKKTDDPDRDPLPLSADAKKLPPPPSSHPEAIEPPAPSLEFARKATRDSASEPPAMSLDAIIAREEIAASSGKKRPAASAEGDEEPPARPFYEVLLSEEAVPGATVRKASESISASAVKARSLSRPSGISSLQSLYTNTEPISRSRLHREERATAMDDEGGEYVGSMSSFEMEALAGAYDEDEGGSGGHERESVLQHRPIPPPRHERRASLAPQQDDGFEALMNSLGRGVSVAGDA